MIVEGKKKSYSRSLKWFLAIVFMALLLASLVPMASAGNWQYRKEITISGGGVTGSLNNFPVLISITDADLSDNARSDGGDIVFTDLNNVKYNHEIEKFIKSTGELVAWVKIDSLPSTDTTIWMWYCNPNCADQSNVEGTWDSNYKMVQHLGETSGTHLDSTANGNDGTPEGGLIQGMIGKIDGADDFGGLGTGEVVNCGNAPSLDITGDITIEAWANPDSFGSWGEILSKRVDTTTNYNLRFGRTSGTGLYNYVQFYWKRNKDWSVYTTGGYNAGTWYHIVATRAGTNLPKIYVNGVEVGSCTHGTCSNALSTNDNDLCIGGGIDSEGYVWIFDGKIDEVRLSNTVRSADWIKKSYNNQNNPGSFLSVGDQENCNGEDPVPELPTIILFSVGLLMLAGYIMLRRRKG